MQINSLYCLDNVEGMKNLQDDFVDLTVTSPPYDGLRKYQGYSFDFPNVAKQLFRITKHGGIVVWVVNDQTKNGTESGTSFRQALHFMEVGFNLHDTMIFEKVNPPPLTHNRYDPAFEYMFVLSKGKPKTFNPLMEDSKQAGKGINRGSGNKYFGEEETYITRVRDEVTVIKEKKYRKNIWKYVIGSKETGVHVAPFPRQLVEDHILSWSNKGDLVFDPFLGSGTTCRVAKSLSRNYLGFDVSQEYVEFAKKSVDSEEVR